VILQHAANRDVEYWDCEIAAWGTWVEVGRIEKKSM
jgi:hypothetical protein